MLSTDITKRCLRHPGVYPKHYFASLRMESEGLSTTESIFAAFCQGYSTLSALTGEMDAARSAGIIAAPNAQMASALAATTSANGSQLGTP